MRSANKRDAARCVVHGQASNAPLAFGVWARKTGGARLPNQPIRAKQRSRTMSTFRSKRHAVEDSARRHSLRARIRRVRAALERQPELAPEATDFPANH